METLKYPTETKAKKVHPCSFCGCKISIGETYTKSTHKYDGMVYDWKAHLYCAEIAAKMDMYEDADEGVTQDMFMENIHCKHDDLMIAFFNDSEIPRFSDVIQQMRKVNFRDKLFYVIRHFKKLTKQGEELTTNP